MLATRADAEKDHKQIRRGMLCQNDSVPRGRRPGELFHENLKGEIEKKLQQAPRKTEKGPSEYRERIADKYQGSVGKEERSRAI